MAKKRTSTRTVTRVVTAKAPTPTIRIQQPAPLARYRKAGKAVRRVGGRARKGLSNLFQSSTPQLTALAGAAILGIAQKNGWKIPKLIDSMSTPANAGLLAFAAGKAFKSPMLDHMATGALSVAIWAYLGGAPISGDYVMGTGVVYGDDDEYEYYYPAQ